MEERGQLEKLFGDRFKTMSSETLANQQKQFIERASQTLKPLSDKVEKLDREWATTSGAFKQQIQSLASETRTLSTALTKPQARGQWGEMQVERALELSGLVKGIHYDTQASDNQGGRTELTSHAAPARYHRRLQSLPRRTHRSTRHHRRCRTRGSPRSTRPTHANHATLSPPPVLEATTDSANFVSWSSPNSPSPPPSNDVPT